MSDGVDGKVGANRRWDGSGGRRRGRRRVDVGRQQSIGGRRRDDSDSDRDSDDMPR